MMRGNEMTDTKDAIQHTEGPWTNRWHNGDMVIYAGRQEVARIETDFRSMQQSLADGRLIAAAPDLLAALEKLTRLADSFSVSGVYFHEDRDNQAAIDCAYDAIAKATNCA
jgi:hypothetical protein